MDKRQNLVLIVDDTPENLRVLGELLEAEGLGVRVATDGPRALEIARSSSVDLILLDIMMPGMDGYQVCEALKLNPATRDVPVIFLTALDSSEDEARGLGLGAVDYISKPFKLELVKSRVVNQIELHNVRQELRYKNEYLEDIVEERTRDLAEVHKRLLTIDSAKYDFLQVIYRKLWAADRGIVELARAAFSRLGSADPSTLALAKRYEEAQSELFETINAALLMSGMLQGDEKPTLHPVRMAVLVEDVVAELQARAEEKELTFSLETGGPDLVTGDMDLVYQVLSTLFKAALIMAKACSSIEVSLREEEGKHVLDISFDSGEAGQPGLDALFDGSTRYHASRVGRELGLAIPLASKLTRAMSGSLFLAEAGGGPCQIKLALPKFEKKGGARIELP